MSLCAWPKHGHGTRLWRPTLIAVCRAHNKFQHAYHHDSRNRLSTFWTPTGGIAKKAENEDSNDLLVRAGFLRQAYSGVFHLLPLGLRVQEKLERLIDKHMSQLGASKLSLSSLSSPPLWKKTGRLKDDSEMFRFLDRKDTPFLLAPTHEEEITNLVSGLVKSYKDLPLRLYQISRKYRDEPRPRQGLLRSREFVMKDLYTFDYSVSEAMKTYNSVNDAYVRLFEELKLPYIVAAADSGNMGGSLSHEFHFPSIKGEDTLISCSSCRNVFNEELASGKASNYLTEREQAKGEKSNIAGLGHQEAPAISTGEWKCISKDRKTLIRAYYPKFLMQEGSSEPARREVNQHALKSISAAHGTELDLSVKDPLSVWKTETEHQLTRPEPDIRVLDIYDFRVRAFHRPPMSGLLNGEVGDKIKIQCSLLDRYPGTDNGIDFIQARTGDNCPNCGEQSLETTQAIELAHTFNLGTRYSDALQANVAIDPAILEKHERSAMKNPRVATLQMGCHGIGISRMVSTIADSLADSKGLKWPRVIAPFQVAIVPLKGLEKESEQIYDSIVSHQGDSVDVILDDRTKDLAWKLGDADLIGYPVILVVGKAWKSERKVEVQCRRLDNLRTTVSLDELPGFVTSLLNKI